MRSSPLQKLSSLDSLEARQLLAGITLITHGLESSYPQWVDQMALAVDKRIEPSATTPWTNASLYRMVMTGSSPVTVQSFTRASGPAPSASSTGEIVIALDWSSISGLGGPATSTVATAVANQLLASGPALGFGGELMSLPIQLIGHSRGGSLITDLARQLGQHGIWVDQVTPLDSYPLPGTDPSTTLYDNVVFADNYYETHDFIVHGSSLTGAHNVGPMNLPGGASLWHSNVHTYYDATIDRGATTDGDVTINTAWWTSTTQRATVGFDWSRISGGTRPADGLAAIGGGTATRTHVALTTTAWDNIDNVSVSGGDANGFFANSAAMTLNYRYQDQLGGGSVNFYLDNDNNPYDGFVRSLASKTSLTATGAQPASAAGTLSTNWSSIGLTAGEYFVYATITDAASAHTRLLYQTAPLFVSANGATMISKRWSDDTANHSFTEPGNWSPGAPPTTGDRAISDWGTINSPASLGDISLDLTASATATITGSQHVRAIGLAGNARLTFTAGTSAVIVTGDLSIAGLSTLDLNDNDMIVDYSSTSPLSSIEQLINSARDGGAWDGAGLTSTSAKNQPHSNTTLGAMEAGDYESLSALNTTFDGQPIDNTAVVIKYTYYGDVNFNGKVDGADFARMDITFGDESAGSIGGWFNGDFDYNGKVDGADYGLADLAFGTQAAPLNRGIAPPGLPNSSPGVTSHGHGGFLA